MSDAYIASGGLVQDDGPFQGARLAGADGTCVSWGAIFAGAAGAAALSLILLILGVGLGLSSISPWSQAGVSATTFGIGTILWVSFTQLAASGIGGYLAGRLRKKWCGVHTDEVYFRDTAHGFLAWSIATLATAALLTGTIGAIVGGGAKATAAVAGGAASTAAVATVGAATGAGGAMAAGTDQGDIYAVESLFRRNISAAPVATNVQGTGTAALSTFSPAATGQDNRSANAEVARIFANGLSTNSALPPEDVNYVSQLIAQRTGISQQEAEKRVTDSYAKVQTKAKEATEKAKAAADDARKASAYAALWLFVSLLLGAFVASFLATFGGRHRDV
ncbi:MAG: hypothetical protein V4542_02050 [Pseudomonadota bacterium]